MTDAIAWLSLLNYFTETIKAHIVYRYDDKLLIVLVIKTVIEDYMAFGVSHTAVTTIHYSV